MRDREGSSGQRAEGRGPEDRGAGGHGDNVRGHDLQRWCACYRGRGDGGGLAVVGGMHRLQC